jgi:hypothetical protein
MTPSVRAYATARSVDGVPSLAVDSIKDSATEMIAPGTSSAQVASYTYDWGVMKTATTAAGTVHRTLNPDGTVASETEGYGSSHARTTEFEYDSAGSSSCVGRRVPVTTAYDPTAGAWVMTSRGAARTLTAFDGLGRPTTGYDGTTSAYLAKVSTSYYPDGRVQCAGLVVAADAPTSPCSSVVYDDVNRLVTETLPDQATRSQSWRVVDGAVRTERGRGRPSHGPHPPRCGAARGGPGDHLGRRAGRDLHVRVRRCSQHCHPCPRRYARNIFDRVRL